MTATTSEQRSTRAPAPAQRGIALAAAVLGFFVVTLDAVVVNVALPSIRHDLGGGIAGLQWVVDGYTLMFAALLLTSGSLADRIGARRAFGLRHRAVRRRLARLRCCSEPGAAWSRPASSRARRRPSSCRPRCR